MIKKQRPIHVILCGMLFIVMLLTACASERPTVTTVTLTPTPTTLATAKISSVPTATPTLTKPTATSRPIPTPIETKTGVFRLYAVDNKPNQARFDLDTETVLGVDSSTADMEYFNDHGTAGPFYYLNIINGARSGHYHFTIRNYMDCLNYLAELRPILIDEQTYSYERKLLCVVTNQDRLALLTWQKSRNDWAEFSYTISVKPISELVALAPTFTPQPTPTRRPTSTPKPTATINPHATPTDVHAQETAEALQKCELSYQSDGLLNDYQGSINETIPIKMTLIFSCYSDEITGSYFYEDKWQDIKLKGTRGADRKIVLQAYDDKGTVVSTFYGKFLTEDPKNHYAKGSELEFEVMAGEWAETTSTKRVPFYLALYQGVGGSLENRYAVAGTEDAKVVEQAIQRFWWAVMNDDKATIAKSWKYPFEILSDPSNNESDYLTIKNSQDFMKYYDKIIPPDLKENLSHDVPHNMFVNWKGIMLGAVWFDSDGYVLRINF